MARVVLVHVATFEADDKISGNWTLESCGSAVDRVRGYLALPILIHDFYT